MKKSDLKKLSRQFWADTGLESIFPRDVETATILKLPITVVHLHSLNQSEVKNWFAERKINPPIPDYRSDLLGCLFAHSGKGFLLVNSHQSSCELRFTISHEIGHFLFDYYFKRQRVRSALGNDAGDVLDGFRTATLGERVDAIMAGVDLKPYSHLFSESNLVSINRDSVEEIEGRADFLADELIAPESEVSKRYQDYKELGKVEAIRKIASELDSPEYVIARQILEKPESNDLLTDLRHTFGRRKQ